MRYGLLAVFVSLSVHARCVRPADMGNFKLLKSYQDCLTNLEKLCSKKATAPDCKGLQKPQDYRQRFPENITLIKPSERCDVQKNGSYLCKQDPIRFVIKEEPKPQPGTGIIPTKSPGQEPPPVNSPQPAPTPSAPAEGERVPAPPPPTPND